MEYPGLYIHCSVFRHFDGWDDIRLSVELRGDTAVVRCCCFSGNGKLNEGRYWISGSNPHVIFKAEEKAVVNREQYMIH